MSIKASERNQEKPTATNDKRHHEPVSRKKAERFQGILQAKTPLRSSITIGVKRIVKKPLTKEKPLDSTKTEMSEHFDRAPMKHVDGQTSFSCTDGQQSARDLAIGKDPSIIANTAIASGRADDINSLIKKLTLNFNANQNEAHFSIATGIFEGAHFSLLTD